MIVGDFHFDPHISPSPHLPFWCAMPWVDVEIKIPRLAVDRTVTIMVDTGSDITGLHIRDAVPILGKRGYRLLRQFDSRDCSGLGGSALYVAVPAQIVFQHDDGRFEGFDFTLYIAKPARKGSKKRTHQLKIPSVLGRDILCHFRLVMDYSNNLLTLNHN